MLVHDDSSAQVELAVSDLLRLQNDEVQTIEQIMIATLGDLVRMADTLLCSCCGPASTHTTGFGERGRFLT